MQEVGGVQDLGLGLGDRLAHLERHHQREVVGALDELLVGAPQDLAALARRRRGPLVLDGGRGGERRLGVLDRRVGDLDERLAGGRILDRQSAAAAGAAPLAADEELRTDGLDDGLLAGLVGRGHRAPP